MGNLICMLLHCQRGDTIIATDRSHIIQYEAGNFAFIGGINAKALKSDMGIFNIQDIE